MNLSTRSIWLICTTSGLWAFSFGLGSQLVTHWLKTQDASDTVVGWTHSFYYFGLAALSCTVPALTRRLGSTSCAAIGMIGAGLTLAAFPWAGSEWSWYTLRFLNGGAGALSLVPLETIVSRDSLPARKTQNFAFYGVSLTLGGALGIALGLHAYQPGETLAFSLGGLVSFVAGVLLAGLMPRRPEGEVSQVRIALEWRRNFLSYGTAWVQGFLEGGLLAFLSLFLIARGFSADMAGILMGAMMAGVIVFQVPVSWLADRFGITLVLLGCYAAVALGLLGIPWLTGALPLAVGLFCFGACTGAMYPLGLSRLSDHLPECGLARAYAWYLAIECVGSQAGAAIMGKARDLWGESAMFTVGLAALLTVLVVWVVVRGPWAVARSHTLPAGFP